MNKLASLSCIWRFPCLSISPYFVLLPG